MEFKQLLASLTDKVISRFFREEFGNIQITDFLQVDLGVLGMTARHQADASHSVGPEFATITSDSLKINPVSVTLGQYRVEVFFTVK